MPRSPSFPSGLPLSPGVPSLPRRILVGRRVGTRPEISRSGVSSSRVSCSSTSFSGTSCSTGGTTGRGGSGRRTGMQTKNRDVRGRHENSPECEQTTGRREPRGRNRARSAFGKTPARTPTAYPDACHDRGRRRGRRRRQRTRERTRRCRVGSASHRPAGPVFPLAPASRPSRSRHLALGISPRALCLDPRLGPSCRERSACRERPACLERYASARRRSRCSLSSSRTSFGLGDPSNRCMTCPMKKPRRPSFPSR